MKHLLMNLLTGLMGISLIVVPVLAFSWFEDPEYAIRNMCGHELRMGMINSSVQVKYDNKLYTCVMREDRSIWVDFDKPIPLK